MNLFRWHRGSLTESMETATEIADREDLATVLNGELGKFLEAVTPEEIEIKPYGSDERIGWENTHIVIVKDGWVMGFTNGPID